MKQLVYRLTSGKIVKTLREAVVSGQGYKSEYSEIPKPTVITDKRREMLAEFGRIKPNSRKMG